ncbi:TonB-dependent receptor [Membranihabitans maritimus]|uniref:TonB-dependent receptor n=1 Tax=Membranihabitans maritimus TaxID=2904244 RepID=UPI001F39C39C|nr:TonB-dependent receptor [Membranihabitans maritimus]
MNRITISKILNVITIGFELKLTQLIFLFGSLIFMFLPDFSAKAQTAIMKGKVLDATNNDAIPYANVIIPETGKGVSTDSTGSFLLEISPGIYTVRVSYLGYKDDVKSEIEVSSARPTNLNFLLEPSGVALSKLVVQSDPFQKPIESPLSLRSIGVSEIRRNPGANRDISKVVQTLPGVTTTVGFRNDLIIRGGSPGENQFFLDGVEIPNINHFATQGAGGGSNGLINVNFIREVDFYSGAFPAHLGNSLSSVFDLKQRNGRNDRLGFSATISGTDAGMTLEGPLGEKTTFLLSARRSYLSFLFKIIGLPFLPTYNDFQIKTRTQINKNNELIFIGLGAIDQFELNTSAGDDESSLFLLENLPVAPQWNYTNGLVYKNYHNQGYRQVVLSRNMLNNRAYRYYQNDDTSEDNLILDYRSQEIENKLRLEDLRTINDYKLRYGISTEWVKYNTNSYAKIFTPSQGEEVVDYESEISFLTYDFFGQISNSYFGDRLDLSAGMRLSGSNYSDLMENPFQQFSPRASLSFKVSQNIRVNANTGIYYQLPPYTVLGYRINGSLVNRDRTEYMTNTHWVAGLEWRSKNSTKISLEGYYKKYDNYPFLLDDSIALANLGGNYGVVGNKPSISNATGKTYGIELFLQQKLYEGFYGILSYTLGWSKFENKYGKLSPSSWDARHIVNMAGGKRFGKNWEVGISVRYQSGLPLTPFDESSNLVSSWQVNGRAIPDYDRVNSLRDDYSLGIDLRIDKKMYFENWSIN